MLRLAHTGLPGRGRTDALLCGLATRLSGAGMTLAGTVQVNTPRPGTHHCDMDLRLLPGGPVLRISESRGQSARGCRLDAGALEGATEWLLRHLERADLLIVNKFGRQEGEGRGLVPVIAAAFERGLPVLVGVNALNLALWTGFAGGLSRELPPHEDALFNWCRGALLSAAA
ncbi:MAG: DUF2478 domain-containing protein [Rubellimicrobium sp.]|nr:DUF2478 domain-containing protein [Rubellimicrobium sp.]